MECSVAAIVRAANAPTQGTSSCGRLPQSTPSFSSFGILFSALWLIAAALLTATACCFLVIAVLSMTKSIAAHSLLVAISPYWLLRCKVNAPS